MPNLELVHKKDITLFRRLAIGIWQTAYDPSVYGTMQIRMDDAGVDGESRAAFWAHSEGLTWILLQRFDQR